MHLELARTRVERALARFVLKVWGMVEIREERGLLMADLVVVFWLLGHLVLSNTLVTIKLIVCRGWKSNQKVAQ